MKKNLKILIITILILCFCCTPCFGSNEDYVQELETTTEDSNNSNTTNTTTEQYPTTIEGLQEKQNGISTQIQQKNEELTDVQKKISETLQQIETLSQDITKYEIEAEKLNAQTEELTKSVTELEEKLEKAEKKYKEQMNLIEQRLLVIHESGDVHYLDVLLNTKSISEFISTYFYITEIVKNDTEVLNDAERERNKIEREKTTLAEQQKQLKTIRDNKEKTTIILENTKIVKDSYKNKLTDEEKKIQEEIEKYETELQQIRAEIILRATGELGEEYQGGIMAWPVPGYTTLTSEFGMRFHPILYVYKLHTGIDIGAPEGANFIAASDGIVIAAEYSYSYGNMVIVDHGGGITTLYAHGSEILVQVGQAVKRGQPVLKVGSTGYSTGPHAHFEVRIDGDPVQPLNFLKSQTTNNTTSSNVNTNTNTNENTNTEENKIDNQ